MIKPATITAMSEAQTDILDTIDDRKIQRYQLRMIITAGTGFFTDAYDLFIIGVVTTLLIPIWHLSTTQLAILNGASLASAALGALIFGALADRFGRKKLYGLEVIILFFGALLCAVSPNYTWLLLSRVVVGLGIGGDYPSSAVVASEFAGKTNRGFLVLLVFAMQAIGLIVGPLFASLLLALHVPHTILWRVLLGFGAIPAASVFYLRRRIYESPRYLIAKQKQKLPLEVSRVVSHLAVGLKKPPRVSLIKQKLLSRKWLMCLFGTAGAWFLLDVAFYGNGVSSVLILNAIGANAHLLERTLASAAMFLIFAFPGYVMAARYVDRIGRKPLQIIGFIVMGVCYIAIALIPHLTSHLVLFALIFGMSFFFVNFGPNTTTFLIPSEIYPTNIRARAHGISAATGKVGAFVGAFLLPIVLLHHGLGAVMFMMGIVSFLGVFVTFLVPEMKNRSLEETELYDN